MPCSNSAESCPRARAPLLLLLRARAPIGSAGLLRWVERLKSPLNGC